jgi:alpha-D-ribose 1-methylphosphonate 5-phosphate C-P lyase
MADTLFLFGAGREKRIYAIPPHTAVEPLEFEDHKFRTENFSGKVCARCGAGDTYLDEVIYNAGGGRSYFCSDSGYCDKRSLDWNR